MKLLNLIAIVALTMGVSTAFAGTPKTEAKSDATTVATPSETKTADATAWFQYLGPQTGNPTDLNNASNYGTSQIDPDELCPDPGTNRCAAEFNVDGSGHRTGSPTGSIATKPAQ